MKTFYLIDGNAHIWRSYFAPMQPLTSPAGDPVKAVYLFTRLVQGLLNDDPDYLAVAFDVRDSTTFRAELFPDYKAHRDDAPSDLPDQLETTKRVLEAMNIPCYSVEGFEADDVIATIAERIPPGVELRVVSSDKDLHQILTDMVRMYDPKDGSMLDAGNLLDRKGYPPELAVEVQTLTGDSTDNIPGANLIGPKTAIKLLEQYGDAQSVLDHAEEQSPKRAEYLAAHREQAELTRTLVTLRRDVPVAFDLEACAVSAPDREALAAIYQELGFRTFLEDLGVEHAPDVPDEEAPAETETRVLRTLDEVRAYAGELARAPRFAFDTETTSTTPAVADLVGFSFALEPGDAVWIPVASRVAETLPVEAVLDALRPAFASDAVKVAHNLKYDLQVLWRAGLDVPAPVFDTMLASRALEPGRRGHGLDRIVLEEYGTRLTPISDLIGSGKNQKSMLDIEEGAIAPYAAEDADYALRLYERYAARVDEEGFREALETVEFPLIRVLARMEYAGVRVDTDRLEAIRDEIEGRIEALEREAQASVGTEFNPNSTVQLREVLFDTLEMRVVKSGKTGPSTDAFVLETLATETDHPLPGIMLDLRELATLRNSFLNTLPDYVQPDSSKIHTSYHQTGTATGRLSSSDPNLQNIPVRSEEGKRIRSAFVPSDPERVLLSADYSQIELRFLAHFSEDPALLEAYRDDRDIHALVASQIFGVPLAEVTSFQRNVGKTVNFGIIYGQSPFGLARQLRIPQSEAKDFIDTYKDRYRGITAFLDESVDFAKANGYVTTILGTRREIPQLQDRNAAVRRQGERLAVNTRIQGSAADLIKVAMVDLDARLEDRDDATMIMQVHDELVFDVSVPAVDEIERTVIDAMTSAMELAVPLKVEASRGASWMESKA